MEYMGSMVILRDYETGEFIAETAIMEMNLNYCTIRILGDSSRFTQFRRVTLLVFGKDGIYECQGTPRQTNALGETEITLFGKNAQAQWDINSYRYGVAMPGSVLYLDPRDNQTVVSPPIPIVVVNINGTSALLSCAQPLMEQQYRFKLIIPTEEYDTVLASVALLFKGETKGEYLYECKF